ncbi:MAG TPA: DUF3881 domain-containing protein [Lachnoclostridium sp.]|jgi:hypothetical protein|uniref:DUF3881 family protein n=1 Tax=Lacrimispora sp. TaxID=2719234 RepID=UPI000ECC0E9B|nr:DUF3881 family protein [Lacrimispora sp.]HCD44555.1 DUF3881 domain-containing protein [Lachnoclostridium sp.]
MHKFLRTIGFSLYQKDREIENLLDTLCEDLTGLKRIQIDEESNLCELRREVAPGMGIAVFGEMDREGKFQRSYYYPYLKSLDMTSEVACSVQRHTERETYAGLLDEYKVGISLIFYIDNSFECRERIIDHHPMDTKDVCLSGLAVSGKVLLPIQKTEIQKEEARVAAKDRNTLLEAAKNGDEDAMETLTIEDIDLYSQASRRVMKEDLYSIIDSCFMPCGVECDQYSIIGEIIKIDEKKNQITKEEVYDFTLECSDLVFHVGIAKKDLVGTPEIGRRFKGQIWMQGIVNFSEPVE